MFIINPSNEMEILNQWETADGAIISTHHCWAIKLSLTGQVSGQVGVGLIITAQYKDWQNNILTGINEPIKISVDGPGEADQELTLNPVNGQAEFNLVSDVPGIFKIKSTTNIPCDAAEIEVTVS